MKTILPFLCLMVLTPRAFAISTTDPKVDDLNQGFADFTVLNTALNTETITTDQIYAQQKIEGRELKVIHGQLFTQFTKEIRQEILDGAPYCTLSIYSDEQKKQSFTPKQTLQYVTTDFSYVPIINIGEAYVTDAIFGEGEDFSRITCIKKGGLILFSEMQEAWKGVLQFDLKTMPEPLLTTPDSDRPMCDLGNHGDLPPYVETRLKESLSLLTSIQGDGAASPLHQKIFGGSVDGNQYCRYLQNRILGITYSDETDDEYADYIKSSHHLNLGVFPMVSAYERISTLIHEARHRDNPGHDLCPQQSPLVNGKRKPDWKENFAGQWACDRKISGSYVTEIIFSGNLLKHCTNCSKQLKDTIRENIQAELLYQITDDALRAKIQADIEL